MSNTFPLLSKHVSVVCNYFITEVQKENTHHSKIRGTYSLHTRCFLLLLYSLRLFENSEKRKNSLMQTELTDKPRGYYNSTREDMLKYIPHDVKKTLEFGCGSGGFSKLIKNRFGAEAWAVEINEKSAEAASKKLDKVINSDAHEAIDKLPDNYFDCIILFDILEHLVDPYSLLALVKKKLTKKGVIVTSIPNIRFYRNLVKFVLHGEWEYQDEGLMDKTHLRFFTRKSLLKMFDSLGFEIITIEGINPTHSRNLKILNFFTLNSFADTKYLHYVTVVRPK